MRRRTRAARRTMLSASAGPATRSSRPTLLGSPLDRRSQPITLLYASASSLLQFVLAYSAGGAVSRVGLMVGIRRIMSMR